MQKYRAQRLSGDAERAGVRRVQMAHAHGVGPVAVNLRVDAPFQRNQTARMLDNGAVDIVDENLLRPHRAFLGAGAWADETLVSARHADRNVAEHADRALHIEHARQCCRLFAQQVFIAHEKRELPFFLPTLKRVGDASAFDDVAPAADFGGEELVLALPAADFDRDSTELDDQRLHVRHFGSVVERSGELVDNRLRRRRRRANHATSRRRRNPAHRPQQ